MELCTCTIRHAGNLGMTIVKGPEQAVTPAEIVILREIHGHDSVVDVAFARNTNRSNAEELHRLRAYYGEKVVERCFPGARPQLPTTLGEASLESDEPPELPDEEAVADVLPPPPSGVLERASRRAARPADLTG